MKKKKVFGSCIEYNSQNEAVGKEKKATSEPGLGPRPPWTSNPAGKGVGVFIHRLLPVTSWLPSTSSHHA